VTLRIGTSGWQYRDWRGVLYPEGLPQRRWLAHYAEQFDCVEVNNAFYRLPEQSTFASWREQTPDGFVVAVKASRYLSHIRRLRDPAEPVARLVERADALGDRLGPYLLQLPPNLRCEPERLDETLSCFPRSARVAVEPRHESWWTDEVCQVLRRHNATLSWADRDSRAVTPLWVTADWGYLRLHRGTAQPPPSYGRQALASWLDRVDAAWPQHDRHSADVFVFFNNDTGGAAIHNARTLLRQAHRRHLSASV
jgi:uncharacterized protein YecE (DUF72 family)